MKKIKLLLLTLTLTLLLTALPITLTSCSPSLRLRMLKGEEQAAYFFGVVNQNAAEATSCTTQQTMLLRMELNGKSYEQITEGTITTIGQGEDMTTLTQSETTVTVGGELPVISRHDYGFADGEMFLYHKADGHESKLRSPITAAEYEHFEEDQRRDDPDITIGEGYCETMSCTQNEDKTWTATYTDFTDEGMRPFLKMLAGVEFAVTADHDLAGVRMTCNADESLSLTALTIEFLFEANPEAESAVPEVRVDYAYRGWNNTVLAEPYDISDFTEVEDVRYVERFLEALSDRETADSGEFDVEASSTLSYGEKSETDKASQKVSFSTKDGYHFTLDSAQNGYNIHINFRDGIMNTTVYDPESGQKVSDSSDKISNFEARASVQQLMNSNGIRGLDMAGAELVDEERGIYRFALGESVRDMFSERYGAEAEGFTGTIEATIVDGALLSYIYDVTADFNVFGQTVTASSRLTVTFRELTEGGETI